ncbi:peptidoglycan DD-metalloendopeptidase family protein [Pseudogracilibacillus auburnensis]|uniref:Stage IV sporulation protein FA n=1 Tax=Pseudogracilibacillus auburnensis TaxID=1494959 RepID=A0A2V3W2Y4_9BACI|nr:M23 family metallopeptidase [Pseudogracilibacillus auburnensis]PXW86615.1 stage IV sporulation protein FA [Pseudogracilibacillus auburnensis]
MDRGVRKVRQSIKQRKKMRERHDSSAQRLVPYIADDQEKHGFESPSYNIEPTYDKKTERKMQKSTMLIKVTASIVLFVGSAFLLQSNIPALQQPQKWAYNALQNEFPFAKVNEWYVTTFGTPLAITPQGNISLGSDDNPMILPVIGDVVETFSANGSGIMISPDEKTVVSAINRGVVIFAGNDKETNKTVIIQHADNSQTTYGFLSSIDVHLYQIVNPNQTIATFQPTEENEMVYFSIEKNNQFIDPSQVIPVDDIP